MGSSLTSLVDQAAAAYWSRQPEYLAVKFWGRDEEDLIPIEVVALVLKIGRRHVCLLEMPEVLIDGVKCHRKSAVLPWLEPEFALPGRIIHKLQALHNKQLARRFKPSKRILDEDTTASCSFALQYCGIDIDEKEVAILAKLAAKPQEAMIEALMSNQPSERAGAWLRLCLGGGPQPTKDVEARAVAAGHKWATVRRARHVVGVEAFKEARARGAWMWRLKDAQPQSSEQVR